MRKPLLKFTPLGIYCPQGKFYIDPWRPVSKALITHAHADHACWGHQVYIAHNLSIPFLLYRYGSPHSSFEGVEYGAPFSINGVTVSFHPAGHIIGSSQIRVEFKGEVWVASGDYKLENDGLCPPFEPVKCDTFITESTFGLPCFQWEPQHIIFDEINQWWAANRSQDITSILIGYSLGKAQRLLSGLNPSIGPIFAHGSIWNLTELIRPLYPHLPPMEKVVVKETPKEALKGALILAPPSTINSVWLKRFFPHRIGYASGWMALRGIRRRKAADRGFVLSDHADWSSLQQAVKESGAQKVIVTHGFTNILARYLSEQGYEAQEAHTAYGGEEETHE
jgi:putative mRNA 3-end processing factor